MKRKGNNIVIQKFGGTSVGNTERILNVTKYIKNEISIGNFPVVVVSAMSGFTNGMIAQCNDLSKIPCIAERDVALSAGETIASSLVAIALNSIGIEAISMQSWQIPICTSPSYSNATIVSIDPKNIFDLIDKKIVPIVTGFQGINYENRITTIGRGGSDTTASAIAVACHAKRIDIYTDVSGIYPIDPRLISTNILRNISFEVAFAMANSGSKVIHPRAVEIAMRYNIPMRIISSFEDGCYTTIDNKGSMENLFCQSVSYDKNLFLLSIPRDKDMDIISSLDIAIKSIFFKKSQTCAIISLDDLHKVSLYLRGTSHSIEYHIGLIEIIGFGLNQNTSVINTAVMKIKQYELELINIACSNTRISAFVHGTGVENAVRDIYCELTIHNKE